MTKTLLQKQIDCLCALNDILTKLKTSYKEGDCVGEHNSILHRMEQMITAITESVRREWKEPVFKDTEIYP